MRRPTSHILSSHSWNISHLKTSFVNMQSKKIQSNLLLFQDFLLIHKAYISATVTWKLPYSNAVILKYCIFLLSCKRFSFIKYNHLNRCVLHYIKQKITFYNPTCRKRILKQAFMLSTFDEQHKRAQLA